MVDHVWTTPALQETITLWHSMPGAGAVHPSILEADRQLCLPLGRREQIVRTLCQWCLLMAWAAIWRSLPHIGLGHSVVGWRGDDRFTLEADESLVSRL